MDNQSINKNHIKTYKLLICVSLIMYICFISVKNVFSAEIALIMKIFNIDKPTASMTTTYYFFTYGITQIVLFFILGKMNLKKYLTITLLISAVLMISVGFCNGITQIYVIYALSGFVQAGLWAGIIAVLSMYLPKKMLASANRVLSLGMPIAGGISYGVSAIFNAFNNWNLPFIILGALSLVSVCVFCFLLKRVDKIPRFFEEETDNSATKRDVEYKLVDLSSAWKKVCFYVTFLILSFLSTALYYAVLNWIPSLMVDVFSLSESVSTLITTIVPLSMMIGAVVFINFCEKYKNVMMLGVVFFAISLIILLFLVFFYNFNMIVSLVAIILFLNIVHGARSLFYSVLPLKMRNQLNSGALAAIANAFASLGASVAPTVIGAVIESSGWAISYLAVFVVEAVMILIMIALGIAIGKNLKKQIV